MNFVRSSQEFHSTDVSHVQDYQSRQGPWRGGGGGYNGPGPIMNNFMGLGSMVGFRASFNRPRFGGVIGSSCNLKQGLGSGQQFGGHRGGGGGGGRSSQDFDTARLRFGGDRLSYNEKKLPVASSYSGFVKPQKLEDHFEGGDGNASLPPSTALQSGLSRSYSAPSTRHPYRGPRFPGSPGRGLGGNSCGSRDGGGPIRAGVRGLGRGPRFGGGSGRGGGNSTTSTTNDNFVGIEAATAAAARATREAANPNAKCIVLATGNVHLAKFKRLAEEIKKLKSKRPNAIDTIHSAANIAHVSIQSEIESGPIVRGTGTFFCLVQFDGINIAVSSGLNKRSSKVEAFEIALQKLNKPFQRIIEIDGTTREFQASDYDFTAEEPKQTVVKPTSAVVANISGDGDMMNSFQKESNVEAIVDIKKKNYVAKDIKDFVLVEPQEHNSSVNGASILRRSADFSKMLLEYDFAAFGSGGAVRCVLKVEGKVLADVVAHSKVAAKVVASQKAVDALREECWTILTKQVHDSNTPEISKDELFDDLASCFTGSLEPMAASMNIPIADSNKGKQLLAKMGWKGGGIGKDGAGIEEPVTMKQVINREGLGLDAKRGISGDFRARIVDILENYTASERQDDLVFSPHFRKDERVVIHNECRRLGLKSKSNGQGNTRYLIVRRKRSAFQLLEHVMRCGGQTARYKVVPPGERKYPWRSTIPLPPSAINSNNSSSNNIGTGSGSTGSKNQPALSKPVLLSSVSSPALSSATAAGQVRSSMITSPMMGSVLEAAMMGQNQCMMGRNFLAQNGPQAMMGQNMMSSMGFIGMTRSGPQGGPMMGSGRGGLLGSKPPNFYQAGHK